MLSTAPEGFQYGREIRLPLTKNVPGHLSLLPQQSTDRSYHRAYQSKEHVFCEGDERTHVFQIDRGSVMLYRTLHDGRRQIVDFAFPGDVIGLDTSEEYSFSAEALSPVHVLSFSQSALEQAARRDPSIALRLYRTVSKELVAARAQLVLIGQRSAMERVATFLLMLHDRITESGAPASVINLPMRRSDIGDFLGLTIETVSRSFTILRRLQVIRITRGTEIDVLDLDRLRDLSEKEPA
jgi:CRP/FNR family transcriptional regulator, anaerobic regulatory protein